MTGQMTAAGIMTEVFASAKCESRGQTIVYFGVLADGRFSVASKFQWEIRTKDRRKAEAVFSKLCPEPEKPNAIAQWHGVPDGANGCPHLLTQECGVPRRPCNGLNIEFSGANPRCRLKPQDKRFTPEMATRWLRSGGSMLVFHPCSANCPEGRISS